MTLTIFDQNLLSAFADKISHGTKRIRYALSSAKKPSQLATKICDSENIALVLQYEFGYNPHSLVSLQPNSSLWRSQKNRGAIVYQDIGRVWLASGDAFGANENCGEMAVEFASEARRAKRLAAFAPTTENFARQAVPHGFTAVKIGASPYFDLTVWNPRGDKAKKMRSAINQATRAGVTIQKLDDNDENARREISDLCAAWLGNRKAKTSFGWLFELAPFRYATQKRYFTARDGCGNLVGLLAASPIPARHGWYLEDVLRTPDAPNGTADFLIKETLNALRDEGAKLATLGTVPLCDEGADVFNGCNSNKHKFTQKMLRIAPQRLKCFYNFDGLRHFKSKFVPTFWESEYVLATNSIFAAPLITNAALRAIMPKGFFNFAKNEIKGRIFR